MRRAYLTHLEMVCHPATARQAKAHLERDCLELEAAIKTAHCCRASGRWGSASAAAFFSRLRAYYRWCKRVGCDCELRFDPSTLAWARPTQGLPRRRTLSECQWASLTGAARGDARPCSPALSGAQRAITYELARWTGLRCAALRQLATPCYLEGEFAWFEVPALKRCRQPRRLPVPLKLYELHVAAFGPRVGAMFPRFPVRPTRMLRDDLARAGIDYVTPAGRFDFHALRYQAASDLRAAGCSMPQISMWLQHASSRTTEGYLRNCLPDADMLSISEKRIHARNVELLPPAAMAWPRLAVGP